jgi:fructose-1,6-bisphosphatase/inositol monophosphatase family enzyme
MHRDAFHELISPERMVQRVAKVHTAIFQEVMKVSHAEAFLPRWVGKEPKLMTYIDEFAERTFRGVIENEFTKDDVVLLGEESLTSLLSLEEEDRPCILVDIIDGTDLLERGLSNWCSAIVIFNKKRIEGAFVAFQSGLKNVMYYGVRGDDDAYKIEYTQKAGGKVACSEQQKLSGPREHTSLDKAIICSYGQKSGNLLELLKLHDKPTFVQLLQNNIRRQQKIKADKTLDEVKFRFYNLAGNPMMVRLADGIIDVVFDLKGQRPHDVVPGAFIAMMAGAVLWDIDLRQSVSDSSFINKLLHPGSSSIKYVLAANRELLVRAVDALCLVEKWDGLVE